MCIRDRYAFSQRNSRTTIGHFSTLSACLVLSFPFPLPQNKNPLHCTQPSTCKGSNKTLMVPYSHMGKPHTTIGVTAFHFWVRNGIRWDHSTMAIRKILLLSLSVFIFRSLFLASYVAFNLKQAVCLIFFHFAFALSFRSFSSQPLLASFFFPKTLEVVWLSLSGN